MCWNVSAGIDVEPKRCLICRQEGFTCGGGGLCPGPHHRLRPAQWLRQPTGNDALWVHRTCIALNHRSQFGQGEFAFMEPETRWRWMCIFSWFNMLHFSHVRLLPQRRLLASPSARYHQFSTSFPDSPRCTRTWVWHVSTSNIGLTQADSVRLCKQHGM